MLRVLPLVLFLPTLAWAEADIPPALFTYDAAFKACTIDPAHPDLAAHCDATITDAYLLKRAVLRATQACAETPLATCTTPFEDEGLPAIAMKIAVEAGCDAPMPIGPRGGQPLPDTHCVTLAADIMEDEGVTPLDADLRCDTTDENCIGLDRLQSYLWRQAVTTLSASPTTVERLEAARADCPQGRDSYACLSLAYSEIWADLAPVDQ